MVILSGDETQFYEYKLVDQRNNSITEEGTFTILHDYYIEEAAQKRRMYLDLSASTKINSEDIYKHFGYRCFKCRKNLRNVDTKERPLDHTLPAVFLWPLTTENATLLCREHNSEKSGNWPSAYYSDNELKTLAVLTGIPYETLAGPPHYNPEAIERLKTPEQVDQLLIKYVAYIEEIIKLRNRILEREGFDFFECSTTISCAWIRQADQEYQRVAHQTIDANTKQDTDEK